MQPNVQQFLVAVASAALVFLGSCSAGCNAPGWEPGPITAQSSTVPIPGLGNATFGGERDTTMVLSGMRGVPGASFPDIDNLTLTRSASGPLATRGGQQQAIELLRWQESRESGRQWQQFAMSLIPAYQQFQASRPAPQPDTSTNWRDEIGGIVKQILEAELAKRAPVKP